MTKDMLDFELDELQQNPTWQAVLTAYRDAYTSAQAEAKGTDQEFDGWLPRIMSVEGLDDDALPKIHGKLIAWGFLKFQLAGRGSGVVYQISPQGRQALENTDASGVRASFDDADTDEQEAADQAA